MRAEKNKAQFLNEMRKEFAGASELARGRARRSARWAPALAAAAAVGSAFTGAAVATQELTSAWKTAVIIIAFLATGVGAGAAALRPGERAETARLEAANANALLAWLRMLDLEAQTLDDNAFRERVAALRSWQMHQAGVPSYVYDGTTPWAPTPGLASQIS